MKRTRLNWFVGVLMSAFMLGSCGQEPATSKPNDTEIITRGDFVYFVTPWRDMLFEDRVDAVVEAKKELFEKLKKVYPNNNGEYYSTEMMKAKEADIEPMVRGMNEWLAENEAGIREVGVAVQSLVPSGFMLMVGGKVTANFGIGGGGSVTLGVLVVPVKVTRINKKTHEVREYTNFRWSVLGLPAVQLGAGAGGGSVFRGGLGLVWGELNDPEDFVGLTGGISGNLTAGVGHNIKAGILKSDIVPGRNFLFATMMFQTGGAVEAELHGFAGKVFLLNDYLKYLGLMNESAVPKEDKAKVPERKGKVPLVEVEER